MSLIVTEIKGNHIEAIYPVVYGDINDNEEIKSYDAALILMYRFRIFGVH